MRPLLEALGGPAFLSAWILAGVWLWLATGRRRGSALARDAERLARQEARVQRAFRQPRPSESPRALDDPGQCRGSNEGGDDV